MPILVLDAQDPDRRVVFANRAYLTGWNHTSEEVVGRTWTYQEAVDPHGPEVAELHAAILCMRHGTVTVPCRRPDGSTYLGRLSVAPITDATGRITLLTVMCEGIVEPETSPPASPPASSPASSDASPATGAAEADAKTGASPADTHERLVGKLAGSVAHDFNNLLSVMLSSLEDARHFLAPNSPATRAVDLTVRAAKRSSELAGHLMAYSRNRAVRHGAAEQVNVGQLIENLRPLLARAVTAAVTLELDMPTTPVICKLDAGRLEDALMNLCLNARDAIAENGAVRISLRTEGLLDKAMAVITVADTGAGMTPEVLARATERNFTTKPEGRGNGLGLSSVQDFAAAAGGSLTLDSAMGKGTKVVLKLPISG
jgi:PAS domain S-box-containing protein